MAIGLHRCDLDIYVYPSHTLARSCKEKASCPFSCAQC